MPRKKTEEVVNEVEKVEEVAAAPKKTAAKKTTKAEEATEAVEKTPKKTTTKKTAAKTEEVKEEKPATKKTTTKKTTAKAEEAKEEKAAAPKKTTTKRTATKKVAKDTTKQIIATGRRKASIARVRIMEGTGKFVINKREIGEYFNLATLIQVAKQPLTLTGTENRFDVYVNVTGGGFTGQAGAIRMGIARCLVKADETLKAEIKKAGFLTRDSRVKERKHYGLKKARKAPQFSKR